MNVPPELLKFTPPKFVPPEDAETHKDIQYSSQGHVRQRLDLYLPRPESRRGPGRIPLVVYIHGAYQFPIPLELLEPLQPLQPLPPAQKTKLGRPPC